MTGNPLPPLPKPPEIPARAEGPLSDAMYELAEALRYPVDSRGRVYDVKFMLPVLAFHLARAGAVIDPARAAIKARRLPPTPGVVEDAVEWVGVNEPDSVDDELADATIADVDKLSPTARAALLRRLGVAATDDETTDLDGRTPWHVETTIHFDDDDKEP